MAERVATVVAGVTLAALIVFYEPGLALIGPTMVALLVLVVLVRLLEPEPPAGRQATVLRWTIFAFVVHLAFGLVVTHLGGIFSDLLRAPDAFTYSRNAVRINQHWTGDFPMPTLPAGKEGYYYMVAAIYRVFGVHVVAGLVVNAMLGAALIPVVGDTTRRLFGTGAARYVPPILVFLPSMVLWPSQLMKEAPILFMIAVAANGATRLTERFGVLPLLWVALCSALLLTFRGHVAFVLAGGIVAAVVLGRRHVLGGVGTGLVVVSLLLLLLSFGLGYSGFEAARNSDLEYANLVRRDLALSGTSGYDAQVDISTSGRAVAYLPRGLVNFFLGPFPWQITDARHVAVLPDMLVWWVLMPSLWRGARAGWRRVKRQVLVLLVPAFTTACLLSLSIGNFGTLVRERLQVVVLLAPVIALGLSLRRDERPSPEPSPSRELATVR